jgi:hypothetical protein
MTADPLGSRVAEGVRSLEVRWIFPGQLETAVAGWFGRFPARTESRVDTYLLDPRLPGLSVKIREGVALEVKVYRGSPGILEVIGRARGRVEAWQKWSFPVSPFRQDSGDLAGWRPVRKSRRISRFSLASGPVVAGAPRLGGEPRCAVELTEVRTGAQDWWTLGFEAAGPADLLRSELQATATLVFAQALPGGVEPSLDESRSYASGYTGGRAPVVTRTPETCPCYGTGTSVRRSPGTTGAWTAAASGGARQRSAPMLRERLNRALPPARPGAPGPGRPGSRGRDGA